MKNHYIEVTNAKYAKAVFDSIKSLCDATGIKYTSDNREAIKGQFMRLLGIEIDGYEIEWFSRLRDDYIATHDGKKYYIDYGYYSDDQLVLSARPFRPESF